MLYVTRTLPKQPNCHSVTLALNPFFFRSPFKIKSCCLHVLVYFLASVIVSPDESEPRALASTIPLSDGRGSVGSGEIVTEAYFLHITGDRHAQ